MTRVPPRFCASAAPGDTTAAIPNSTAIAASRRKPRMAPSLGVLRWVIGYGRGELRRARPGEHGMQKDVRAGLEMLGTRVLDLVVADAVLAGHEDHRGRRDPRHVDGVVAGAARQVAVRKAKRLGGTAHGVDAAWVEAR